MLSHDLLIVAEPLRIGYWLPFQAAKAVAATFCYKIRYALVPLFGPDFVTSCIKPGHEGFGHIIIDSEIVKRCAREAEYFRNHPSPNSDSEVHMMSPDPKRVCVNMERDRASHRLEDRFHEGENAVSGVRPRTLNMKTFTNARTGLLLRHSAKHFPPAQIATKSAYKTLNLRAVFANEGIGRSPSLMTKQTPPRQLENIGHHSYLPSPQSTSGWRSNQSPQPKIHDLNPLLPRDLPTPTSSRHDENTPPRSPSSFGSNISPKTTPQTVKMNIQTVAQLPTTGDALRPPKTTSNTKARSRSPMTSTKETRAAYVLMQLHIADTTTDGVPKISRKRRASS